MRIILGYEQFNCNISQDAEVEVNPVITGRTVESYHTLNFDKKKMSKNKIGKIIIYLKV